MKFRSVLRTLGWVVLAAANGWVVALNYDNGAPCGDDGQTVGFAIAAGYYTSSNVTAANFLNLVNPGATYHCGLYLGYANPTGYLFHPASDVADSYGACIGVSACLSGPASTGVTTSLWGPVTGYWNQEGNFTSFPRGAYTVVAADEWGNSALVHFTID